MIISNTRKFLYITIFLLILANQARGLYCEPDNCYELLEVSSSSTPQQIKKAYRTLARRYHPDKNKHEDTTQLFQKLNIAYEILDNEHTRAAYDAFLIDPTGSQAYHAYQFYKARYSPQTNPFLVLALFVLLLSWLQWVMRKQMHQSAINRIMMGQNFKIRVNEQCAKQGRKGDKYYKEEVIQRLQQEICIEGGYSKPELIDLLACKIVIFPYTLLMFIYAWIRWIGKYYIKRDDYTRQDQEYLTKKALKVTKAQWEHMPEPEKENFLKRRLWVRKNMDAYKEEMRARQLEELKLSNPAKYRKIMAYLKKNA